MPQMVLQIIKKLCTVNILGRDILGLRRVTYFEALFSLICLARMSEFDVEWDWFS